ncbi:nitrate- and nitrite sensing domain-containing protein [Micromonospora profundi]|uniref:nitrate- and nitrite sensing domain-containing protein n=1 Tax=Micromonospora profundi TaxID=1420889 RepID=UPI003656A86E
MSRPPLPMAADHPERAVTRPEARHLRARLVAVAAVLVTLWTYAAYLTCQDTADLLRVRALADTLGQPIDRLILSLQTERRLTVDAIAADAPTGAPLGAAREVTDRAAAEVRAFTSGGDLRLLTAGAVRDRAEELVRRLNGLGTVRSRVDAGRLDSARAVDGYDQLVDVAFDVYGPEWGAYESRLATDSRAVIALARARELLAREDTLVTAALAGERVTAEQRRQLTEQVTIGRYARAEALAALPVDGQAAREQLLAGPELAGLRTAEDALLATGRSDTLGEVSGADWRAAADAALDALHAVVTSTARVSVERATPGAAVLVARTGTVVGLGLIAVLVVLLGWVGAVRRLAGQPVGADRPTGPGADWPAGPGADRPVSPGGEVRPQGPADAVAAPMAVAPAVGEPCSDSELLLRVTRRNQVLLRDQLDLLDGMQRRERAAEETDELFQLDHLATRIRRNVEKVITLAGAAPARRWRRPVPLLDVARGAVAEVPDYHRVLVAPHWPWSLAGPAVTDVVHLLAELIENALSFSAADTTVRVSGEHRPQGCAVVVVDDGPGLDAAALTEANHLLGDPPPDGPPAGAAGLYTVAVLAARCGAHVALRPSQRGGTAAIVLLPPGLVTVTGDGRPGTRTADATSWRAAGPSEVDRAETDRTAASGAGGHGGLPLRIRQPGPTGPEPGSAGPDTVELPVARATRRHR